MILFAVLLADNLGLSQNFLFFDKNKNIKYARVDVIKTEDQV